MIAENVEFGSFFLFLQLSESNHKMSPNFQKYNNKTQERPFLLAWLISLKVSPFAAVFYSNISEEIC